MASRRFSSKIDAWLVATGFAGMAAAVVAIGFSLYAEPDSPATILALLMVLLVFALVASTFLSTYYEVDGDTLTVRSGPFRWRVPLEKIDSVTPTRSPLSSPALSLDRLDIRYGKRRIMVSPADKRGFLKAIGQDPRRGS
jgi:hypothetical protein